MREGKERIIFNNYDLWETAKKIVKEYKNEYDEEITEDEGYDIACQYAEEDWNNELDNLKNHFDGEHIIMFGGIGRWNGTVRGWEVFDDFEDALYKIIKDCDYIKIYDVNGHFYIECSHHDGTNYTEIKKLTDGGKSYLENWEYSYNDKRSPSYVGKQLVKKYSVLPRFAEKVYGCKKREYV